MLEEDLAIPAHQERLGHAVDAPVDRGPAGRRRSRSPRRDCRGCRGSAAHSRACPCSSVRRWRNACPATAPAARDAPRGRARTTTPRHSPASPCRRRSGCRSRAGRCLRAAAASVSGAGWPISADGMSAASRPERSCNRKSAASPRKSSSGSRTISRRRLRRDVASVAIRRCCRAPNGDARRWPASSAISRRRAALVEQDPARSGRRSPAPIRRRRR